MLRPVVILQADKKILHIHTRAYTVYILQSYILSMYTVCKYINTNKIIKSILTKNIKNLKI